MTLVCVSQHFGLLWVGVEATTLASAPLIYFHRQHRSLEATWKYLLICSVGIALALLGNFLLAVAAAPDASGAEHRDWYVADLLAKNAAELHAPWLKAAFLFFLVGYGTKMGLAPMHTWLPDAHSESPSVVSALLVRRAVELRVSWEFCGRIRCAWPPAWRTSARACCAVFGLVSMAVAAVFILGQVDFKRMLAYSSVEHMGILVARRRPGRRGAFGAGLHADQPLADQGLLVPGGRQHPGRL